MTTELTVVTPDLLSVTMTKDQVLQGFRDLKQFTVEYIDAEKNIINFTKFSKDARDKACELAFRLKENNNWKLANSDYKSWTDCIKNEFGGILRQEIDRMVQIHEVNRVLPKDNRPKSELQMRVLAQVPDAQKEEVFNEAKRTARINKFTGLPQVSAKGIAEVAEATGLTITGLPEGSKPKVIGRRTDSTVANGNKKNEGNKRSNLPGQNSAESKLDAIKKRATELINCDFNGNQSQQFDAYQDFIELLAQ